MILEFSLVSAAPEAVSASCLVVGLFQNREPDEALRALDQASSGALQRAIDAGDVADAAGKTTLLLDLPGLKARRVLVVGLGKRAAFDGAAYVRACETAGKALRELPVADAVSWLPALEVNGRDAAWALRTASIAADQTAYRYTTTLKPKTAGKPQLERMGFATRADEAASARALDEARAMATGVRFARELANLPPNICNPEYLAEQARGLARDHEGVEVQVLERDEMERLGMGSLLAVGQASANPPKLIVLRWNGGEAGARPQVLVGKGITFDTGGVSIKPGPGMQEMKFDMGGAAGVMGAFLAAVTLKLPINLACVVPAAENMPGGKAYRPGDVLTSLSGQTIEVQNTDAEGRLILCDAITWAARNLDPDVIVDAATLTGACVIALGAHASGLMTQDEDLARELLAAGEATHDRAWRLPLWDDYQGQLDSVFADMANIGGKSAGTITAGCFLSRFTEGRRWAHLDVAGTAWDEGSKGLATGRPVRLLTQYLIDRSA